MQAIEDWKERNLRRVDIAGMSVWVCGAAALKHLEAIKLREAKMEMALHRISKMHPDDHPTGRIAREAV